MVSDTHDNLALEQIIKDKFGMIIDINQVIARKIPVSRAAHATVILTGKKQLFVYISGQSRLLLGDVKKIVSRMGLKAEQCLPPRGQPDYFNLIAEGKFKEVFPGRRHISENDLIFYKTLAPYNPALVQISEVKNGEIRCFDPDSASSWRTVAKFAYRRIKTS